MVFTVTMNPSYDYFVQVPCAALGVINRASAESLYPGGKGINVSVVLQRLGIETCALGFIAGFIGDALQGHLHAIGIATDFIRLPYGSTRINVKLQSREETAINGRGPAVGSAEMDALLTKLERLQNGDVLVLSGNAPTSLSSACYEQVLALLEGKGVLTVVDATGETLRRVLPRRPFLIKPNTEELAELLGGEMKTIEEITAGARQLQQEGARNVLVSRGSKGAILLCEDGSVLSGQALAGKVVSTVGAGDSMVAGFLAGWLTSGNQEKAFALSLAAGSATAFCEWLAEKEDILNLISVDISNVETERKDRHEDCGFTVQGGNSPPCVRKKQGGRH